MAYIQPNGVIQLFRGINIDNRYMHTIYFANTNEQSAWFSNRVAYTFQNQSYTRYTRNQIKLKVDPTSVIDCTYLRFMNDRSVDKWFYAFINTVEYVNENTALITYEIDVMQTWFIQNGDILPCMVLREHVNDDTFGINLEEEPIGSSEYDCDAISYSSTDGALFGSYSLIVNTTEDPTQTQGGSVLNNNLYNGSMMRVISMGDANALSNFTNALNMLMDGAWRTGERPVEVIDMFTFPTKFSSLNLNSNRHQIRVTHPANLDGYTPKNKKLFGYPFSYLQTTTKDGDGGILRWEYFAGMLATNNTATFMSVGSPTGGGCIICYPRDYNGITENVDCKLTMSNFPKNPFNYDAYQAWLASGASDKLENQSRITDVRGIVGIGSSASQALASGVAGVDSVGRSAARTSTGEITQSQGAAGIVGGVNQIVQGSAGLIEATVDYIEAKNKIAFAFKDAKYVPNQIVGKATPNIAVADNILDFYFYSVHVRKDELLRLDDFLSAYGYAINKVKKPNLTGRQYWNFVQTQNCAISGNIPASSKAAIAKIFDGGITFWHNGDQVGNYQQSISSGSINNPII